MGTKTPTDQLGALVAELKRRAARTALVSLERGEEVARLRVALLEGTAPSGRPFTASEAEALREELETQRRVCARSEARAEELADLVAYAAELER